MELLLGISVVANFILIAIAIDVYKHSRLQESLSHRTSTEATAAINRQREANDNLKASNDMLRSELDRHRSFYEDQFKAWKITAEKAIRDDANKRSRAVIRGQATEHLVPFICTDYAVKDYRFLGNPIDFLICDGLSAIKDKTSTKINWVVLMDVKTGNAQLSKSERRIRDAIVGGRVKFVTYNPDTKETREWKHEISDPIEG